MKRRSLSLIPIVVLSLICLPKCGQIVDKDSVVIAHKDGKPIRQRTLNRYLRNLVEEERPLIQTKSDLLRALNKYIDIQIKTEHGRELLEADLITVSRDVARQIYFAKNPERYRMWSMVDPAAAGFDLTLRDLEIMKQQDEFGIDDEEEALMREAALNFLAQQAVARGEIPIRPEEMAAEYEARKEDFVFYEEVTFIGVQYALGQNEGGLSAAAQAAQALQALDEGVTFDEYVADVSAKRLDLILESVITNDPNNDRYKEFWEVAAGSEEGQILSALLPPYTVTREGDDGEVFQVEEKGAAHLVFRVEKHLDGRTKTFEEAEAELRSDIQRRKMMTALREQHGVQVYEDALENPAGIGDRYKGSMIKTTTSP